MDFSIRLKNGLLLQGFIQGPGENARAVIIMVHGLGEHVGRYDNWAVMFRNERIGFAGLDLPGHGRSGGRRG
ncbi:MAG TPA: alpha/beta hydrolase, partial [Bacteroidales bacterium]|nr:alpha/beta hydrolase [Bacteroidales bacterium]